jgi:hypothetical protein
VSAPLEAVLAALPDAKRSGKGWTARCPAHEDGSPSLSIAAGTTRGVLLTCFAGCEPEAIVRALGLDPATILGAGAGRQRSQARADRGAPPELVTVAGLARHKGLPEAFLRELGLRDAPGGRYVEIPYYGLDGRELFARRRTRLQAKQGSQQPAGVKLAPYGLKYLEGWATRKEEPSLLTVEGESDCWAGWRHGGAVLGLPGAQAAGCLEAEHVQRFSRIYVHQEPNGAGARFVQGVRQQLERLGWAGQAYAVQLHHNGERIKDLADLHLAVGGDRSAFWAALVEAKEAAVPLAEAVTQAHVAVRISELDDWPEPASLLGIPAAPPLDLALFPPELANVALDATARIQCPPDYVPWALVAVAAGLIGPRVGIRPRQRDDWSERACLWPVLIGEVSWMKTPAIQEAVRPLRRQEAIDHAVYEKEHAAWESACDEIRAATKRGQKPALPPEPVQTRRSSSDATIEKLGELMAASPGLTMVRDEIAGLVGSFNRYSKGESDRQFWLECYSGGLYPIDRIGRGSVVIADLYVGILGGTQPDRARELFGEGPDDGFAARVTGIYPEQPGPWQEVDRLPDLEARKALEAVCDKLVGAEWGTLLKRTGVDATARPFCRLSVEAGRFWSEWHNTLMGRLRSGTWEGRRAGRAGKYQGLAARLALVWHLVEWAAGRVRDEDLASVPLWTLARVLELMDTYVEPMDDRLYGAFDQSVSAGGGERIARWLVKERPSSFTLREIRRHRWSGLGEPKAVEQAVEWLAAMGWVREADPEQRPGRPSARFEVNPAIPEALA